MYDLKLVLQRDQKLVTPSQRRRARPEVGDTPSDLHQMLVSGSVAAYTMGTHEQPRQRPAALTKAIENQRTKKAAWNARSRRLLFDIKVLLARRAAQAALQDLQRPVGEPAVLALRRTLAEPEGTMRGRRTRRLSTPDSKTSTQIAMRRVLPP